MPDWLDWILPFVSGFGGVGIGYGVIKQSLCDHGRRLDKMEDKLEKQVGEDHCTKMRKDCENKIEKGFTKVETQLANVNVELKGIAVWMAGHNGAGK